MYIKIIDTIFKLILPVILLVMNNSICFSNQNPIGIIKDKRIKLISYDNNNIVTIHAAHYVSTVVTLNSEEQIVNINIGDPLAWKVSPSKEFPFVFFLEPQLQKSDTNMTVITNQRMYQFRLLTNPGDQPGSSDTTYALRFKYPNLELLKNKKKRESFDDLVLDLENIKSSEWNYNYSFHGSKNITPVQAYDNGTVTVFKFAKNSAMPAIFSVDNDRNESIVNFRVRGNYVLIDGVERQYTLRNGYDVTTIYNDAISLK